MKRPTLREELELLYFAEKYGWQDSPQWRPLKGTKEDKAYLKFRREMEKRIVETLR